MEKVQNLLIPDYVIPTAELVDRLSSYHQLFFFYRRGIVDLLDNAIDMHLRISKEYQPPGYYEYDNLLQITLNDFDVYAFKYMKGQKTSDMPDLIELALEYIEPAVEKMLAKCMPPCDYEVKNRRWMGNALFLTLVLP